MKGGGDESLVQFGGSGTGGGYDGVAASAESWIREAGENLRKQAQGWVTHRTVILNVFLGNDGKVRFSVASYKADDTTYIVIKFK